MTTIYEKYCTIRLQITKLWARHYCACVMLRATRNLIWCSFLLNILEIHLQRTKLGGGHDFAASSCCDLDIQGSDPHVARDKSSQYGDHFCEIVLKNDFQ